MRSFMDEDFLLTTEPARVLYHDYAEKMPIIDYHCHISPREIWEDRRFENITRLWLGGDHYKWRLMRANGIEESYITGAAPDHDKFIKWAETLERAIGNPLYHWSHLELKRYFGYNGILNGDTAEEVWQLCNEKLMHPEMSARGIMRMSGVELICTTDDPADTLEYHRRLAEDGSFDIRVLPTWRPDRALNIEKPDYQEYLKLLGDSAGMSISCYDDIKAALRKRMEFFSENGCRLSDHGLDYVMCREAEACEIEEIVAKTLSGQSLSADEVQKYKTDLLRFSGTEYNRLGWTMQLHYGCRRNNNTKMYDRIGADTGFDCILNGSSAAGLAGFLDLLDKEDKLPKTIIYSLDPNDNTMIETVMGCFQNADSRGKLQHGSAWWFNDNRMGMQNQLVSLAGQGLLGNFIGMLTDSRSFISYTRHEYFRRIMCEIIGGWADSGEYPWDSGRLGKIVQDIAYNNALSYFGF